MSQAFDASQWAVILGGSSGFGLAAAQRLATDGMSIALVHRDRKGHMAQVEEGFDRIRTAGARLITFNADALDSATQANIVERIAGELGDSNRVRLLLHAVARGNLKPLADPWASSPLVLEDEDFAQTIYAMGTS